VINKFDRIIAFVIIFLTGWNWGLPVGITVPIWFTPVQVVHGVFLYEAILLIYLAFLVVVRNGKLPIFKNSPCNNIIFLIVSLGCLGLLSNAVNIQPLKEMGEVARFFVLAAYFLLCIYWAKKYGPTFILRNFLLGLFCSGIINIYYSFIVRINTLGNLPFLLGQNGPGGMFGLSVVLSAWLMLESKNPSDDIIAISSFIVSIFAASISYSKLAMLMAGFGLIPWGGIIWRNFVKRYSHKLSILILTVFLVFISVNLKGIISYVNSVKTFIDYKFFPVNMGSIRSRYNYFVITSEIVLSYPLFGVGSGGFYDAAITTVNYDSELQPECAVSGEKGLSNPHNSFLYYASANGILGLILTIILFFTVLKVFSLSLLSHGFLGRVLWLCLCIAYFIYGMTLPTLFNTMVLYLPVAVAVSLTRQKRLSRSESRAHVL
jgi:hypothetical protein